jgi:hypothetical protein
MHAMWRPLTRLIPLLLLVVFGAALTGVAFESDVSQIDHYDGDDDDAGHVGKVFSHDVDVVVAVSSQPFVPLAQGPWLTAARPIRLAAITRGPFNSRAPPA